MPTLRSLLTILAVSLLLYSVTGCDESSVTQATRLITTPADRSTDGDGWWGRRHRDKLALVQQGGWNLVFIGDSITQGWEEAARPIWDRYYAPRIALNLGYKGDRIEHVLWRLEHGEIDGFQPKVAVILIGTNNTGFRLDPPQSIAAGIGIMIGKLRQRWPETKLLLLGLFPRGAVPGDPQRINNASTNELLAKLGDGRQVFFLDIGASFLEPNGKLSPEVMPDYLHLGGQAYLRWAEAMEPTLRTLLGEKQAGADR